MLTVFILFAVQCVFTLVVIIVLKKCWDKELIQAAIEKFAACTDSPDIKKIDVRSASRISEEFKSQIESIRQRKFTQANLNIQEDPSLKGGIVITVGDLSLDFSLSSG